MMMSVWHLLWIAPVCSMLGFLMAAMLVAARDDRDDYTTQTPQKH